MAQQTAVEWLVEQLDEQVYRIEHKDNRINISISFEDMMTLKKQAKQMEKKQMFEYIKKLYVNGNASREFHKKEFEQYYNETYKQ